MTLRTNFDCLYNPLLMSPLMFALASLVALIHQVSGTPYIPGGDSPAGTDCSGLASWVTNTATGRPTFGDRFNTGNEEAALLARGFQYGTAPNALVVGWNSHHTAVTLPDGTPVSSGEGGGVRIGGGGAYQSQFTHHMFLPADQLPDGDFDEPGPVEDPAPAVLVNEEFPVDEPAPIEEPAPVEEAVFVNAEEEEPLPAPETPDGENVDI
ncbi:peptidoglycan endopeptidase [Mycobacterium talmoniae]